MKISPNHNLAISTGFEHSARQSRSTEKNQQDATQAAQNQLAQQVIHAQIQANTSQQVRATTQLQPLFEQTLTHRGTLAKNVYQGVEFTADAELLPRLDVMA